MLTIIFCTILVISNTIIYCLSKKWHEEKTKYVISRQPGIVFDAEKVVNLYLTSKKDKYG